MLIYALQSDGNNPFASSGDLHLRRRGHHQRLRVKALATQAKRARRRVCAGVVTLDGDTGHPTAPCLAVTGGAHGQPNKGATATKEGKTRHIARLSGSSRGSRGQKLGRRQAPSSFISSEGVRVNSYRVHTRFDVPFPLIPEADDRRRQLWQSSDRVRW